MAVDPGDLERTSHRAYGDESRVSPGAELSRRVSTLQLHRGGLLGHFWVEINSIGTTMNTSTVRFVCDPAAAPLTT